MMTVLEKLIVDTLRDLGEKDKHICGWSSSLSTVRNRRSTFRVLFGSHGSNQMHKFHEA